MTDYIKRAEALTDFESCNAENQNWTPQRVKTLLLRQPAPTLRRWCGARTAGIGRNMETAGIHGKKVFFHRHIHSIFAATEIIRQIREA